MLEKRLCNKCDLEKDYPDEFVSGRNFCKKCRNDALKLKRSLKPKKEKTSKEHKIQKIKEWQQNNPEKRKLSIKKYNDTHKNQAQEYYYDNKEKIINRVKHYRINNRKKINLSLKERRKNPLYGLRHRISVLIRFYIQGVKNGSVLKFLPYTIQELKNHLESQFEPWMNWKNWGKYNVNSWIDEDQSTWKWQIDHIIPQSKLPYTSMEDENFKKCWALDNIRPYSAKQNILDGDRK